MRRKNTRALAALREWAGPVTGAGWIALAADGPERANIETTEWCFAMVAAAFDTLQRQWPGVKRWAIATGGFSGGAKRSAYIGAKLAERGQPLAGIFFGGCNADRLTDALRWHKPGAAFLDVPMYFSTGDDDPMVSPDTVETLQRGVARSGFKRARFETYKGGHALDAGELARALAWFRAGGRP
jgi:predicted esterase